MQHALIELLTLQYLVSWPHCFLGSANSILLLGSISLVNGCYYYYLASLRSETPNFLYAMRLFLVAKMLVTQGSDNSILTGGFLLKCLTVHFHEFESHGRLRVWESFCRKIGEVYSTWDLKWTAAAITIHLKFTRKALSRENFKMRCNFGKKSRFSWQNQPILY